MYYVRRSERIRRQECRRDVIGRSQKFINSYIKQYKYRKYGHSTNRASVNREDPHFANHQDHGP